MRALLLALMLPAGDDVTVEVLPTAPYLERQRGHLSLHCDFRLTNTTSSVVSLVELRLDELDEDGDLVRRRSVNGNGTAPGILTLQRQSIPPGGWIHLFNPLYHFELGTRPAWMEFRFTLRSGARQWTETIELEGQVYETQTPLRLPLDGRLRVWDGHDFLSHHRRLGMSHPVVISLGLKTNSSRYASDFVVIGEDGEETRRTPVKAEDWYGWGAAILAPAPGRVVRAVGNFPDNQVVAGRVIQHPRISPSDMETFAGNYVVLDHGNGEFSSLGHLRKGSVKVRAGQEVKAGDLLGEMGLSGSTTHVHLHYQLQDSADMNASVGLPSAFKNYRLIRPGGSMVVSSAPVDTGDIIEHEE